MATIKVFLKSVQPFQRSYTKLVLLKRKELYKIHNLRILNLPNIKGVSPALFIAPMSIPGADSKYLIVISCFSGSATEELIAKCSGVTSPFEWLFTLTPCDNKIPTISCAPQNEAECRTVQPVSVRSSGLAP